MLARANAPGMSVTLSQVRTQIADRPQFYPPNNAGPEIITPNGGADGVTTQYALTYENWIPGTLTIYTAPAPSAGSGPTWTAFSATAPIAVATTSAASCGIGVEVITPGAITNIAVGRWVRLDPGLATQEDCQVTAQAGGTFTCVTTMAHAAGFSIIGTPAYSVGAPSTGVDNTNATNQIVTFLTAPAAGTLVAARYQVTAFSDTDLTFFLTQAQNLGYSSDLTTLKRVHFDIIPLILGDQRRMRILSEGAYKNDPSAYAAHLSNLRAELAADLEDGPLPGVNLPQIGVAFAGARRYTPYK